MPIDSNTELQDNWNPRLSVASMVPNVTFLTLNAVFGHREDFWGVAGKFPGNYIGGVFSGQALGGIFASATNIVMLAFGASDQNSGFYSFIIACVFLLTSLVAFVAVTRTKFYKYYDGEGENKNVLEINPDGDQLMEKAPPPPESSGLKVNPLLVLKEIWVYALSVFLVFVVTLGCFPGITAAIKSTGSGTSLAEVLHFPKPHLRGSSWYILMAAVLRVIFIPLFLFCNVSPSNRHMTSVIFESDTIYILLMILFSVSNGYISSICMMSAPGIIKKPEEQSTAASLMVAFLGLGLGVGGALF
ncbi:SLC29A1_2_3 [Lepeophtheirus salmonis]|uniref:SLC29A1_2_3 n=1 Tax=Lepeophtheirus salmonis TaxID=72036 RepID=A0A7R8D4T7_LEPSM|nr:SLC29A1_2_3 [Lepeophtheirus salmonis]CAF3029094.1 SLC29A1_2_3 [Lepeophtheirus salmonis]